MAEQELSILTLNCWGLKFVSKNRRDRVVAIANELSRTEEYDIVTLQELWVYTDFEYVRESVASYLPYAKFFYSGALGAGLAIFSRFPIIATEIQPYSLNGAPIDVAGGDWFVGKAAASVIIIHPELGEVQIFNTHLYAKGGEDGPEHNRAHRLVNAWEFAKLARRAAELGRYVIAAGDFNSIPTTLPMTVIREHAGLVDSWLVTHPFSNTPSNVTPSPQEAIDDFGVTADSPINTYSAGKGLDATARKFCGKRLDYIFYRQPHSSNPGILPVLHCKESRVVFTHEVPGTTFSFSDHFGLNSVLQIQTPGALPSANDITFPSEKISNACITTMVQALTSCYRFSKIRAQKELALFVLCVMLLITTAVASTWFPYPWINPIFIVFTIFLSWLGTTMLYEGFVYGQWECNALMNVVEELEVFKQGLEVHSGRRR
ncbi:inositol phosphophingolipids phospholipase C [Lentinula lateritia]|uniref:Inositol phosphophingolipids phospholipase C n=1 Tax=Lentinula aff. lateritia TaxID=2804960 RepID=A0ACC1TS03_9AGAR|nr:inositol phosphophingolipids phospholipase C [Lentinula aff. lateritia]KAJ3851822.1 inositol phosphophingolipids phospholipase C [Lentinula lateritia]